MEKIPFVLLHTIQNKSIKTITLLFYISFSTTNMFFIVSNWGYIKIELAVFHRKEMLNNYKIILKCIEY